jgi:hypothetical protein
MNPVSFPVFLSVWNSQQKQQTPDVHIRIASWLERRYLNGDRRLLLMAFRACGKSTLVGLFAAWLLYRNQSLRILVVAADLQLSRKMARNVKRIIEKHILTAALRPDSPDQWAADRFTIIRDSELRDPSMLARSVLTNLTGSRADIVICDDVEVPNTCDTADKRASLRERLGELDFILTPDGLTLYVGTPHSYFTLYADTPRSEIGESAVFLENYKRLVVPIIDKNGQSAWPDRYALDDINAMRVRAGPNRFASQMLLQPMNIAQGRLDPKSLIPYRAGLDYTEAGGQAVLSLNGIRMQSACAWWDPSFATDSGDKSVLAIVFSDGKGQYYLHKMLYLPPAKTADTDEATRQCRLIAQALAENYVPLVGLEINGLGRFLPGLLRKELTAQNLSVSVREVSNRRPKDLRILEAFDAVLAAKALHVHADVLKTPFALEMAEWRPGGKGHDDGLDAVAGALSLDPLRLGTGLRTGNRANWQGVRAVTAPTSLDQ